MDRVAVVKQKLIKSEPSTFVWDIINVEGHKEIEVEWDATWNFNSAVKCTLCQLENWRGSRVFAPGPARHAVPSQAVKTSVKSITPDHFEKKQRGRRVCAAPCCYQYFIQQMRNARKKLPFSRLTPQRLLIWYRNNDHFFLLAADASENRCWPNRRPRTGARYLLSTRRRVTDSQPSYKTGKSGKRDPHDPLLVRFAWFYQFRPTDNESANRMF